MRVGNLIRHVGTDPDRIFYLVIGTPESPHNEPEYGYDGRILEKETYLTIYSLFSGKRGIVQLYDLDCWEAVA